MSIFNREMVKRLDRAAKAFIISNEIAFGQRKERRSGVKDRRKNPQWRGGQDGRSGKDRRSPVSNHCIEKVI